MTPHSTPRLVLSFFFGQSERSAVFPTARFCGSILGFHGLWLSQRPVRTSLRMHSGNDDNGGLRAVAGAITKHYHLLPYITIRCGTRRLPNFLAVGASRYYGVAQDSPTAVNPASCPGRPPWILDLTAIAGMTHCSSWPNHALSRRRWWASFDSFLALSSLSALMLTPLFSVLQRVFFSFLLLARYPVVYLFFVSSLIRSDKTYPERVANSSRVFWLIDA